MKYSVLYKSVSISVCNTSSRFSYEFRHFGWTNKLTCEKKKTNFRNGGKICLPRAPTSSSLLRIVNSNFYRTATQSYDVTQRRRRAKVVSSIIPQRYSKSLLSESFSTAFSAPLSFFSFHPTTFGEMIHFVTRYAFLPLGWTFHPSSSVRESSTTRKTHLSSRLALCLLSERI